MSIVCTSGTSQRPLCPPDEKINHRGAKRATSAATALRDGALRSRVSAVRRWIDKRRTVYRSPKCSACALLIHVAPSLRRASRPPRRALPGGHGPLARTQASARPGHLCQLCREFRTTGRTVRTVTFLEHARHRPVEFHGMGAHRCCVLARARCRGRGSVSASTWTPVILGHSGSQL